MAAPVSPPGGYAETRDGKGAGIWRVSAEGKVKSIKGELGIGRRQRKPDLDFFDPP